MSNNMCILLFFPASRWCSGWLTVVGCPTTLPPTKPDCKWTSHSVSVTLPAWKHTLVPLHVWIPVYDYVSLVLVCRSRTPGNRIVYLYTKKVGKAPKSACGICPGRLRGVSKAIVFWWMLLAFSKHAVHAPTRYLSEVHPHHVPPRNPEVNFEFASWMDGWMGIGTKLIGWMTLCHNSINTDPLPCCTERDSTSFVNMSKDILIDNNIWNNFKETNLQNISNLKICTTTLEVVNRSLTQAFYWMHCFRSS